MVVILVIAKVVNVSEVPMKYLIRELFQKQIRFEINLAITKIQKLKSKK